MNELEIINLYEQSDDNKNKDFYENINSNLRVVTNYDKTSTNFEWLDIMEDTIRYLDNILRNPNRFIVSLNFIFGFNCTIKCFNTRHILFVI